VANDFLSAALHSRVSRQLPLPDFHAIETRFIEDSSTRAVGNPESCLWSRVTLEKKDENFDFDVSHHTPLKRMMAVSHSRHGIVQTGPGSDSERSSELPGPGMARETETNFRESQSPEGVMAAEN
jgi:hypothetical protein